MRPAFSRSIIVCLTSIVLILASQPAGAEKGADEKAADPVQEKIGNLTAASGLLDLYPDPKEGKLWVVLPKPGDDGTIGEYLYLAGMRTGLGSNPVGIDRGQMRGARLVRFRLVGNKVLVEQPNLDFRAESDNAAEVGAVRRSFAFSVLWAGTVVGFDGDQRPLVDLTSFLLRDDHGISRTLQQTEQGSYSLDSDRSVVDFDHCLAFPDNVELEAVLTFSGKKPGRHVRSTAPDPESLSFVSHHSFVRLPDDGYTSREFDSREGFFFESYLDYAVPLDQPMKRGLIARHRLEKTDPTAERSTVVDPIVYYVDPGAPEPVKSALIEGASWWADAFDAAGFIDGFRVEVLPEDAHPLDVRYNVIQWVHRSTRGWSYGNAITDPRTGEIVKGHVSLGSLRVRQDIRIFESLLGTERTGTGMADDPVELALARIRQLSAHEVGHTLGITHNFAASVNDRASVMDYPAPLISVGPDGALDASQAYAVGIGAWDSHAVTWGYGQHAPGVDEAAAQEAIVRAGIDAGLLFISDADARPAAAAHPLANLWDNGDDPIAMLEQMMEVRAHGLARFGEGNIAEGQPLALLEETLAPLYFYHRFQVDAAAKSIAGVDYAYAVRGDGQPGPTPVAADRQRRALDVLLAAIDPSALDVPDSVLDVLAPRPFGYWGNRELFDGSSSPIFDPLAAAASAGDLVVDQILQPVRLNRALDQHRRDPEQLGAMEIVDAVVEAAFGAGTADARRREIERTTQTVVVQRLLGLAADTEASPAVRAIAEGGLLSVRDQLADGPDHGGFLRREIDRYLTDRTWEPTGAGSAPPMPPGSPIGAACTLDDHDWSVR